MQTFHGDLLVFSQDAPLNCFIAKLSTSLIEFTILLHELLGLTRIVVKWVFFRNALTASWFLYLPSLNYPVLNFM